MLFAPVLFLCRRKVQSNRLKRNNFNFCPAFRTSCQFVEHRCRGKLNFGGAIRAFGCDHVFITRSYGPSTFDGTQILARLEIGTKFPPLPLRKIGKSPKIGNMSLSLSR